MESRMKYVLFLYMLSGLDSLELVYPPTPGVIYSPVNTDVTIPCNLTFPDDEQLELLMWYKESTYVVYEGKDKILHYFDASIRDKYSLAEGSYDLTIYSVVQKDMANYTCEKTSKKQVEGSMMMKETNTSTELIVQENKNLSLSEEMDDNDDNVTLSDDIPSPPGIPDITEINSRDAVVSWKKSLHDNNSPITNYIIRVKKESKDDWVNSRALLVNGNTTSILIRDLIPNTSYQIRVEAKNALGNSEPSSSSIIFSTKPEIPEKPPQNLKVVSPESTKIQLTWDPPPVESRNGIPRGYVIKYEMLPEMVVLEVTLVDPERKEYTIELLKPFTDYKVSILLFNDVGNGPPAMAFVKTAEGVPDKPRIIHYTNTTSTSFGVLWEAPKFENGVLKNYQLQCIHDNMPKTHIITDNLKNPKMTANITSLEPYTQYQLRVRATTGGGYSEFSEIVSAITDVAGPTEPSIVNLTVISSTDIFIQWEKPKKIYKKVSSYVIEYWSVINSVRGEVETDGDILKKMLTLPTNNDYMVRVAGVTQSIFSHKSYKGKFSEALDCRLEDPTVIMSPSVEVVSAGMVAGIIVGALVVITVIFLFVGYRSLTCRKYTRSLYYLAVPTSSQSPQSTVVFPPDTIDEDTKYQEIKVSDFLQHVRSLHADGDNGFSTEFDEITSRTRIDLPADASDMPENKAKNRYVNISAFDHSRVILQPLPGKPKSDYINGNFIDGYNKPHAYIATQGPLPHTFSDYWRMIWEQGTIVIVMITNLVERGRRKCDMYWPEEGVETYGCVTVKHMKTFSRAHYTVRMFSLKSSKIKKKHVSERIVYQYHYTEWPDHGVPDFTLPVLKFIQKSSGENPPGAGPIVIHCSAGVGRTGTYMLIDTMIKQIKDKDTVNIPAFLLHIRQQRNFLVQTEEQYMLIHDAIAEYILTQGDTEIRESEISKYLSNLLCTHNGVIAAGEIQYNLVTSFTPKPDDMFHALKSINVSKNRSLDMVPLSVKRVFLPMKPGIEGSDYINATYLHGYNKSNEFIITQHPLEQTMEDFWRMVWDQNSSVIVQLSDVDADENDFRSYWPEKDQPIDIGCFKLTYREDDERKKYMIREFLLQSNQDDYILMTRIVTPSINWPEDCQPLHQVFDLIDTVHDLHQQNDIGPVIVVDKFGGVEAATFCALWSIYDQMKNDKAVNIYQLAKLYHLKRAGVIGSKENYLFLYRAAESLSKEWSDRDRSSSPGSVRLHLGSAKKNGTLPRSVTINSKVETDV